MPEYNHKKIEEKWRKEWEEKETFGVEVNTKKKKYYALEMFPYPSGSGLHVGHGFNYTIGDIYARFKRMKGFNVLYPMGYDSFGLPAENAAIQVGERPQDYTKNSVKNYIEQQKALGLSYDWSRMIKTSEPEYYKWNQYFFLKFLEKGLAYRKKSSINWCPKCDTVLANEQVHSGKCWRHEDTYVEVKQLEQWFIKTTLYAEELLNDIEKLDWPERIKIMQRNWIGKSVGTEIKFKINDDYWTIFTTRPDTLYGVTFMVVAANHPNLNKLVAKAQKKDVDAFLKKIHSTKQEDIDQLEKEGVFTGSYAEHPLTNEKIPVYAGNFVIAEYGSGMVMAVPAHDQRDFEFAKKYNIPIKIVVEPKGKKIKTNEMKEAYTKDGVIVNSSKFDGINNEEAKANITEYLESKKIGKKTTQYKLRDWLISRQRYWGTPIPVIYCKSCGIVPAPENDLPVKLPEKVSFGKGNPLESNANFVNVKCPKCRSNARRETDTMDTFFDSSWYFLRFTDSNNPKEAFSKSKAEYWMPVDQYIGGAEHACMHLIYARFFTKALRDLKFIKFDEPFTKLFNQGMVHGEDGQKMSKSKGNVRGLLDMIEKYGADALRIFLVSVAGPDKDFSWSNSGIESAHKFVVKIFDYMSGVDIRKSDRKTESRVNKAIKEIENDIINFSYNLAVIKLRKLFDDLGSSDEISREDYLAIVRIISPFCPHVSEELWEMHGGEGFASTASWPDYEESKIDLAFEAEEEIITATSSDISSVISLTSIKNPKKITMFVSEPWKYDFIRKMKELLEKTHDMKEIMNKVMQKDLKKYGNEISKLVPKIVKDAKKIPELILDQEREIKTLKSAAEFFISEFKVETVEIVKSQDSKESKAKQAMPGKPALLIE